MFEGHSKGVAVGHIKEELDDVLGKFQDYVYNDVLGAETEYVRMALEAVGINKGNAERYGFDYLFENEEE